MKTDATRVLIIEDNLDIREATAEILALAGYQVLTAEEGKTGVEVAMRHLPDIILCDIMMPELDGYGVLYMLSKSEDTAQIPFIFLTAKSERGDVRKAMEMGADDYLTKPFDELELLNAVETRLKKRRQQEWTGTPTDAQFEIHLAELIKDARLKTFRKKQLIYQEADMAVHLYYIKKGQVRSFLKYVDGRELSTGIYGEGSFFGYESLLLQARYPDNAETLQETEVVMIERDHFFETLYRRPSIANQFIKLLSGTVRLKEEQLLGFAYDSVRKRVANALIHVTERNLSEPQQDTCKFYVSRDDLAALAGTATETISRTMSDFREEKLIAKEGNAIRIYSIERLRNIKQ